MLHRFFRVRNIFIWLCMTTPLAAQEAPADSLPVTHVRIEAGLGISGMLMPSVWNYINTFADLPSGQNAGGFIATSEFFFNTDVRIDSSWSVGLEYSYGLWSHSWTGSAWDFEEKIKMPALCLHYVMCSDRSFLRLGGSIGYYISDLSKDLEGQATIYRAHGLGLKTDAAADMALNDHVFCSLTVDIRGCLGSSFTNNGTELSFYGTTPKISFLSTGIKFGINYQL